MKILLAVDGSPSSNAAVDEVARRNWEADCEVRIISVVETPIAFATDTTLTVATYYEEYKKFECTKARDVLERAIATLQATKAGNTLRITSEVLMGSPKHLIVEEAERFGADLVVVGSHGYSTWERILIGSVSQAVAAHAECSVLIVRDR